MVFFVPCLYLLRNTTAILHLNISSSGNNLAADSQHAGNEQGSFHMHVSI